MPAQHLRTSDIARAVGVHPNTVRMYEEWGLLPAVPRTPNGYRLYTPFHLDQMRVARSIFGGPYTGDRSLSVQAIKASAQGRLEEALQLARENLDQVHAQQDDAQTAVQILNRWAAGEAPEPLSRPLLIGGTAERLGVSRDVLRNWDRDGLLEVPRDPANGYRRYGARELARLRVIKVLRQAGYSPMAVLRLMLVFDEGRRHDLDAVLDTPRPDEDVFHACDRWITALAEQEACARELIAQLQDMLERYPDKR